MDQLNFQIAPVQERSLKHILDAFPADSYKSVNSPTGLYDGKAGASIVNYLLSDYPQNDQFVSSAESLLEEVCENIGNIGSFDYDNGLAGIGWAIEWLAQNGYQNLNTDEFLEEIDDVLYQSLISGAECNISLANGTLGKAAYFQIRRAARNPVTHRMRSVYIEVSLVVLVEELVNKLIGIDGLLSKGKKQDSLSDIGDAAVFLSMLYKEKFYENIVENALYETIKYIDASLDTMLQDETAKRFTPFETLDLTYLGFCYYLAGCIHQSAHWMTTALGYLYKLLELKRPLPGLREDIARKAFVCYSLIHLFIEDGKVAELLPVLEDSPVKDERSILEITLKSIWINYGTQ